MTVWRDLVGQEPTVEVLLRAVGVEGAMTHAWLITGPPGSGRSNAARAFAAALRPQAGCGDCRECRTALDGSHADVNVVATEGLSIQVRDTRDLVQESALRPSVGRWRVIIIEDADRLTERAADALLKALEEPTPRTVWMLCAQPRGRHHHDPLALPARPTADPTVHAVAELLERRDGVDPPMALHAARAAQSHIGLARRLAKDEGARIRRRDVIAMATKIVGVGDAIDAATDLAQIAGEESAASTASATPPSAPARDTGCRPDGAHAASPHPRPAGRAREGAEDPSHPACARHDRPVAHRPHVGLP